MGYTLHFHVSSISLESFERFSLNCTQMFPSVRRCAELILSFADSRSRSHFKVMAFTLHFRVSSISPEPFERFSFKFHLNVPLSETVCRTHNLAMQSEGQGHTSRSCDLPFHVRFISPELSERFSSDFTQNVPLSKMVCRNYDSAMQTRSRSHFKVMRFTSHFHVCSVSLLTETVCTTQDLARQTHRLKPKVILQGHGIYPSLSCFLHNV